MWCVCVCVCVCVSTQDSRTLLTYPISAVAGLRRGSPQRIAGGFGTSTPMAAMSFDLEATLVLGSSSDGDGDDGSSSSSGFIISILSSSAAVVVPGSGGRGGGGGGAQPPLPPPLLQVEVEVEVSSGRGQMSCNGDHAPFILPPPLLLTPPGDGGGTNASERAIEVPTTLYMAMS